ncbi:MAG: winged helix-turn-helix domain-containing protein [Pseudomonadota bacterium]
MSGAKLRSGAPAKLGEDRDFLWRKLGDWYSVAQGRVPTHKGSILLYQFDNFIFDSEGQELRRAGELLHTEPQVLQLLDLLLANHGRVVSREEINSVVWRGRIVSDATLSSRVKLLRQLLDDDGQRQRLIRTVHKRGFRFVGELAAGGAEEASEAGPVKQEPTHSRSPRVLILPFVNMSSEPDQEYLVDGITTDILGHVGKYHWLNVVARNTAFGFKGSSIDIQAVSAQLDVDYVVEGTAQRSGDRVRVNVSLVDASNSRSLWSERFDREFSDIFQLQDDITGKIVARLVPEIGYAERNRVLVTRPATLEAWDCYHMGMYHFFRFTGDDNLKAQSLFRRSCEIDERFGDAWVWWAYATVLGMVYWETEPTREKLDEALYACDRAVAIDGRNATFYALRARVLLARGEYDRALLENKRAIELNPTLAVAYCALGDSLAYGGQYDESLAYFEKSIELSPNDPQLWAFYTYGALALLFKRDFERALTWLDHARGIPNFQYWTIAHRVVALAHIGRSREAEAAGEELRKAVPAFSLEFARQKLFYLKDPAQLSLYLDGLAAAGIE